MFICLFYVDATALRVWVSHHPSESVLQDFLMNPLPKQLLGSVSAIDMQARVSEASHSYDEL